MIYNKTWWQTCILGYEGYPATLCVSVNEVVIHGIPNDRPFKEGDIVSIDSGIILDGYFSDAALTIPVGKVSQEAQKLIDVTKECLYLGIAQVNAHARIFDISRAIFSHATKNGFKVVRQYCGHGVGLAMHEDPQIPNYVSIGPNPRLMPGMVLAIEPMINIGTSDVRVLMMIGQLSPWMVLFLPILSIQCSLPILDMRYLRIGD